MTQARLYSKLNFKNYDHIGNRKKNAIQVVLSENRLKGNFVSKFTVNLSKCNLKNAEISLLSKGLKFVAACNNIGKANLKMEWEVFGRILLLKWHFHNENEDINCDMFKSENKFNPCNKDTAIELCLSGLEEKLMKVEFSKEKFNNLTNSKRKALYDLEKDKSMVIKSANKGSALVA